ncbi:hypothetical protein [Candidatus Mycoplasma haematohominis]|uniref:Uncharacterized protein n=1 Tax=Candidatus Mycoplasma haematohominis TaxID=1494318 RepID=A0A478FTV2_9MOLU|nr:hypothetical protein [Candidatus Mycoplasma haemohominis]GCE63460.1 hypothetical protein MHSWG343_04570 [Candidatus Mycoplasma haemohominis]
MFNKIGKLVLIVLGISSPFITTIYLTNAPKAPKPFEENITLMSMIEIEEEDKIFISDGTGDGDSATVGGNGGGGDKGTDNSEQGDSSAQNPEEKGKENESNGKQTLQEQKSGENGDEESKKDEPKTDAESEAPKEQKANDADSTPQETGNENQDPSSSQKSSTGSTNIGDPCEDILTLFKKISEAADQNLTVSNTFSVTRNVEIISQCVESLEKTEKSG